MNKITKIAFVVMTAFAVMFGTTSCQQEKVQNPKELSFGAVSQEMIDALPDDIKKELGFSQQPSSNARASSSVAGFALMTDTNNSTIWYSSPSTYAVQVYRTSGDASTITVNCLMQSAAKNGRGYCIIYNSNGSVKVTRPASDVDYVFFQENISGGEKVGFFLRVTTSAQFRTDIF